MLLGLNIETIINSIYHVPISYIIFYYFIVLIIASVIKIIMGINIEEPKADFGIFKIDKSSFPTLLIIAWFGLIYKFTTYLKIFDSPLLISLWSILLFLLILILIKKIQVKIQSTILIFHKKKEKISMPRLKERGLFYAQVTHNEYSYVLMSIALSLFCLIFSYLEFGFTSTILTFGLIFTYLIMITLEKILEIKRRVRQW